MRCTRSRKTCTTSTRACLVSTVSRRHCWLPPGSSCPMSFGAALPFLRAKHLCQLYLVSAAVLTVASGAKHHHMGMCLFVVYGTWFAWIYLRFYQRRAADLEAGDQSEEMSFEAFWPEPCQPLCANLGSVCFRWCCVRPADVVARAQQRGGSEAEPCSGRCAARPDAPTGAAGVGETQARGAYSKGAEAARGAPTCLKRSCGCRGCFRRGRRRRRAIRREQCVAAAAAAHNTWPLSYIYNTARCFPPSAVGALRPCERHGAAACGTACALSSTCALESSRRTRDRKKRIWMASPWSTRARRWSQGGTRCRRCTCS